MARTFLCDGCDAPMTTPDIVLGHVYKREYCAACAVHASAYLARLDALRAELVRGYRIEVGDLREEFDEKIKKLPDDPFPEHGPS